MVKVAFLVVVLVVMQVLLTVAQHLQVQVAMGPLVLLVLWVSRALIM